jgi:hypothetical protein
VFDRSVNVVQCAPRFDPVLERLPLDGQPIIISTPSPTALVTAANHAAQEWETALSNYGIAVDFTVTTTQGCQPLDNHCIQVFVDLPPDNPAACAQTLASTDPTGVVNQRVRLYIPPAHSGWSQAFVNSAFAHEIGHVFGLDDLAQDDCSNQSIMKTPVACNNMTGLTQLPTADDAKTVANTT